MNIFLINFTLSFLICLVLINTAKKYKLFLQNRHQNVQKVHKNFIPRLGGLSLISFYTIFIFNTDFFYNKFIIYFFIPLLIILLGFIEDISDSLNSKIRAILSSLITIILILNLDYKISEIDIEIIDKLFYYSFFSFIFMFFCLFVSIHSMNLIDGMNGLCSGYSIIIIIIFTYLFYSQNLFQLSLLTTSLLGSILGFFILNFPYPKIFLGDSGSYFLGFIIGILSIIAVNELDNISPWFFALVYIYPITEFLFSIIRRIYFKKNPFQSDFKHLHSIIYTFINNRNTISNSQLSNSISSFIILNLFSYQIFISLFFLNNKNILLFIIFISLLIYFFTYTIFTKLNYNK